MRATFTAIQLLAALWPVGAFGQGRPPVELLPRAALREAVAPELVDDGPTEEERAREHGAALESWLRAHGDARPPPAVDRFLRERASAMVERFAPGSWEALAEQVERAGPAGLAVHEMRRHAAPRPAPMLRSFSPEVMRPGEETSYLNAPVTWMRAVVHTTVARDGSLLDARVVASSGVAAWDREALERAREDAARRAPPERIFRGRDRVVLAWAFEIGDVATPVGELHEGGATITAGCVADVADLVEGEAAFAVAGHGHVRVRVIPLGVVQDPSPAPSPARTDVRRGPGRDALPTSRAPSGAIR